MCLLSLSCPYMSSKLEETEINLEEALQNISASKGEDKKKKDLLFSWRVSTELHVPLVSIQEPILELKMPIIIIHLLKELLSLYLALDGLIVTS